MYLVDMPLLYHSSGVELSFPGSSGSKFPDFSRVALIVLWKVATLGTLKEFFRQNPQYFRIPFVAKTFSQTVIPQLSNECHAVEN